MEYGIILGTAAAAQAAGNASCTVQSGGGGIESLGFVVALFGAAALFLSYQLIYTRSGLDAQIAKKTQLLRKLQAEIQEREQILGQKRADAVRDLDPRVSSELKKAMAVAESRTKPEGFSKEYWDRIETMGTLMPESPEMKKLIDERDEVENMIALTKDKYLDMDKKAFNSIIEGYQKRLIEIDAKINKLKADGKF